MEDVAGRAGVAKGTVYLHFASKEALFERILQETLVPVVAGVSELRPGPDEPVRAFAERLVLALLRRLQAGQGAKIMHLLIAEGPRFPRLAEIYFRAVVAPGLRLLRGVGLRAGNAGDARAEALRRFPQLIIAPVLTGLLWGELFGSLEPLDVEEFVRAQLDLLFGAAG